MENIAVNEYVRTKDGHVGKVVNKTEYFITLDNNYNFQCRDENKDYNLIIKHSFNIIDLIEVGDYVNGERAIETHNRANDDGEKVILTENYNAWTDDGIVSNKYIKTIVTREQFKGVMYEVK